MNVDHPMKTDRTGLLSNVTSSLRPSNWMHGLDLVGTVFILWK